MSASTSLSQSDSPLPSYAEVSGSSSGVGVVTPGSMHAFLPPQFSKSTESAVVSATECPAPIPTPNPQRYSSLFPQLEFSVQTGPPPTYESATSSLPDRTSRHQELPKKKSKWRLSLPQELTSSKPRPPPQPEGVLLELVVDRFGNRKRELKWRSTRERLTDKSNFRSAFRMPGYFISGTQ